MPILALMTVLAAPAPPRAYEAGLPGAYAALADKRFDDAIATFSAAVEADPAALPQAWGWGMALYGKGDLQACLQIFERILAEAPAHGRALYGRGLVRLRLGGDAEGDLRAALAVDTNDVRSRFRLAQALAARGAHAQAASELGQVLARRWIHQPARHALILALRDAGDRTAAAQVVREFRRVERLVGPIRATERAVRAHPDRPALREQLKALYEQAGRTF